MVIDEALRLYPPVWIIPRRAIADDEIAGYRVPKATVVNVVPFVLHRHPGIWERPEAFEPERWLPERAADRPRYAYIPFGGGPRLCIGNTFALTEMQLVVATLAQRFRLRLVDDRPAVPHQGVTLGVRGGLRMRLERRAV
jgi:cytochrome P450